MISFATGLNKRGHRELFENRFSRAVELFTRAFFAEPENREFGYDLIYALNQNADYVSALRWCYAFLGQPAEGEALDELYFLTAEAFGGLGAIEPCAQMLERCLKENPHGGSSADAQAFLDDLRDKYDCGPYDITVNTVEMGPMNGMTEAPFLNLESFECVRDVGCLYHDGNPEVARKRIEAEFKAGNYTVSLLSLAIMIGESLHDRRFMLHCAEQFKNVEDYTLTELRTMAAQFSALDDNEIAYKAYRLLYEQESGEKDIAFGFAVACEQADETEHARSIAEELLASDGGFGPARYYLRELGEKVHSYIYEYEFEEGKDPIAQALNEEGIFTDPSALWEASDYLRFASPEAAARFFEKCDGSRPFHELVLRTLCIQPEVSLPVRAQAAHQLLDGKKEHIYFNTGTDIVEFEEGLEGLIHRLTEENNEKIDRL